MMACLWMYEEHLNAREMSKRKNMNKMKLKNIFVDFDI